MNTRFAASFALSALALTLTAPFARAQTQLGPTPYLSFADSPLAAVSFSSFYLENFEDGLLNTPGVAASAGTVSTPGAFTDSVDADDGALDGSGAAGRSFFNNTTNTLTFTFDPLALGGLPTHAGLVWTDVGFSNPTLGFDNVTFSATGAGGVALGANGPFLLGDGSAAGGTAEDRFFGIVYAGGISSITITMANSTDWEVDHLQYGIAAVPEPGSFAAVSALALCSAGFLRRRGRK